MFTGSLASTDGLYGKENIPVFLTDVNCSGNEKTLLSCTDGNIGGSVCSGAHAGVLCSGI